MPKIYTRLSQHCDNDTPGKGDWNEGWSQSFSFDNVCAFFNNSDAWYDKSFKLDRAPGDIIWIVVENIATGDSFGYCDSQFHIREAFSTEKEAIEYITDDKNKNNDYFGGHNEWLICKRIISESFKDGLPDGVRYA